MATAPLTNPYLGYWFSVNVPNIGTTAFAEATLASISIGTTDYREGTDDASLRTLPGMVSYGNVTLRKGLMDSLDIYKWVQSVLPTGTKARQSMSISVIDGSSSSSKILANWNFSDALPISYETSGLDAKSTGVIFETLVLDIGGMERTK